MGLGINPSPCLTLSKVDQSSYKLSDGLELEDNNDDGEWAGGGSDDDLPGTAATFCCIRREEGHITGMGKASVLHLYKQKED